MAVCIDAEVAPGVTLTVSAGELGIREIRFVSDGRSEKRTGKSALLDEAVRQMRAYFAGGLREFDLPLEMEGTDFQKRVWRELLKIPYGRTRSYLEIAEALGSRTAVRAVGAANGANPIAIVVPCHRVIGAGGRLVGYGGGLELKRKLLELERGERVLFQVRG